MRERNLIIFDCDYMGFSYFAPFYIYFHAHKWVYTSNYVFTIVNKLLCIRCDGSKNLKFWKSKEFYLHCWKKIHSVRNNSLSLYVNMHAHTKSVNWTKSEHHLSTCLTLLQSNPKKNDSKKCYGLRSANTWPKKQECLYLIVSSNMKICFWCACVCLPDQASPFI